MSDQVPARLAAQLLSGPRARSPEEVVARILAVQAQDPRGARLAIRARSEGLTATGVDRAFTQDRSLIITWLNRGTLHLVRSEDYSWLFAVTAPRRLSWVLARLKQLHVSPEDAERTVATIERVLTSEGPLTRDQLRDRIAARGLPTEGQALVHQIGLASFRGLVVRGPMVGAQQAFVLTRDWLGEQKSPDRERAFAELARRYLAGHGPASDRDLAYWAGIALRDARAGLRSIGSELAQRPHGLVDLAARATPPESTPARLLGSFDPLLHGWASREPIVGGFGSLVTSNGIFRPIILLGGRAAGTWSLQRGRVSLRPFRALEPDEVAALESDAADVHRYLAAGRDGA